MIQELEKLFERQALAWPQLASGLEGLERGKTRRLRIDWFDVFVRHLPHRAASTKARVDRESVAKRPCFLCTENLPPEEEGLRFDDDFTIYCNPFPVVDCHLTIAHKAHGSQSVANRIGTMLDLAVALPGYFVIYNGPECGASAPDHMHFQAGSRALFPIEKDTCAQAGITIANYHRNVFLFRSRERSSLIDRIDHTIDLLAEKTGKRPEPLINIAVFHERGEWVSYLFPRAKHRPQVFYTGELTISPGAIDLCGIVVAPMERDFERVTGDDVAAIFREVTLPAEPFLEIARELESER